MPKPKPKRLVERLGNAARRLRLQFLKKFLWLMKQMAGKTQVKIRHRRGGDWSDGTRKGGLNEQS